MNSKTKSVALFFGLGLAREVVVRNMSADMWGGSSSDEDEVQKPRASGVRINKAFEARYNERNRREELLNVRKGRSDLLAESSDESTSEEEDEEGNLLTANVEATVARTLAMIRNRDPKIYQPDFKVNYGVKADAQQNKSKTDKPMYVKDYARYKHADDLASDSLDTSKTTHDDEAAAPGQRLTYNQEQADLKKELQAATAAAADDSDEDDDGGAGLFTVKRVLKPDGSKAAESATVAESDAPVSKDEAFLENYISQRKWAEADPEDFVPSYKEIIEEVKEYEKAEEYEKKYNFRYEEAGGTEIVGHSRKVEGSLRRSKDKRKLAREEKRRRKAEEKARRAEELKRLKNLKRKEIAKKLSQIQELAGSKDLVSKLTKHADEIDDEFDPDAHDKMMRKIFDEEYYSDDEEEDADAVGAAVRPDDTEAGDTETDNTSQNGEAQPKKKKELPSHVQEILDEEFKLDFEDVVGGLPTRFKYKKVEANDYGLTAEEILNATDAELRQYVIFSPLSNSCTVVVTCLISVS